MKAGKKIVQILKIGVAALIVTALAAYMVYAAIYLSGDDGEARCEGVELMVNHGGATAFIDEAALKKLLKDANVYPKGMRMRDVSAEKIENLVRDNDFVASAECFKTPSGRLSIRVRQRIPVALIIPDGRDGFFVDAEGFAIPNRGHSTDLVVASGDIDEAYAAKALAPFGRYLQQDKFWDSQIEQIYVRRNSRGKRVVELVPRVGGHIIYMGSMDGYEKKLRKLKIFYERAIGTVGWDKYSKLSLEYGNQIICTKRK